MSRKETPSDSARDWIAGLVTIIVTVVCLTSFARISLGVTIVLSAVLLTGLVVFFWLVGKRQRRGSK